MISLFLIGYRGVNEIEAVESDDAFAKVVGHDPRLVITYWNMPLADSVSDISPFLAKLVSAQALYNRLI